MKIIKITYLDVICNSMLIFDRLLSCVRVNVRYSIEVPITPQSGLVPTLTLTDYSSGLT